MEEGQRAHSCRGFRRPGCFRLSSPQSMPTAQLSQATQIMEQLTAFDPEAAEVKCWLAGLPAFPCVFCVSGFPASRLLDFSCYHTQVAGFPLSSQEAKVATCRGFLGIHLPRDPLSDDPSVPLQTLGLPLLPGPSRSPPRSPEASSSLSASRTSCPGCWGIDGGRFILTGEKTSVLEQPLWLTSS